MSVENTQETQAKTPRGHILGDVAAALPQQDQAFITHSLKSVSTRFLALLSCGSYC